MGRMTTKTAMVALFLFLAFAAKALAATAKEPEDLWQELNRLTADERQRRLVAGAKAEGKAVLYGNISSDHLERLRVDFEKRYGVKIDGFRASGERVANRLLTESRAGKLDADVLAPSNEHMPVLIKAGIVGRYNSPERAAFGDIFRDKQNYWTAWDYNIAVIAYNTRMVSPAEAPKRYDDFLEAKWKGNFALDMDPDKSIMGWLKTWGEERTKKYLQAISKNDVVVRKGHTLMAQLLCAGEFKAAIDLYAYRLADLKHSRGCPVEISYPDPTPATPAPIGVVKKTPRPFAAALLLDYILSEPAQKIFSENGRVSGRRDVRPRYPELDVQAKGVKILVLTPEDAVQYDRSYQQLREDYLLHR